MKKGLNRLLAIALSFAMVLTGFTFLGGAVAVNADDVDNTILNIKVVDEDGNGVAGISPKFTAYKQGTTERVAELDIPGSNTEEDWAANNKTDADGVISFDLTEDTVPFNNYLEFSYYGVKYEVGVDSEDYTCEAPAVFEIAFDMETEFCTVVDSVNGGAYDGSVVVTVKSNEEPVAATEITQIDFDKTEYSADETITVTLTGTGLDALTAADFGLEFDGEGYGDYIAYNYGNIAVTPGEGGTSATVTFNLSAGNKAYRFTAKNYVASSVTNNPQVIKYKAPPAKTFTRVEFNATEFTSDGGTLTATVTGENLGQATAADFGLWIPDPEYGEYGVINDSGIVARYEAAADGLSATATFEIPANTGDADIEYTFNVVKKPAQYYGGTPTFYTADEVTGAKTIITVKAPEAAVPEGKPENVFVYIENDQFQPAAGGSYVWSSVSADYTLFDDFSELVDANDYALQTQDSTGEWIDVEADLNITFEFIEEYYDSIAKITATIPDNEDTTDKLWRIVYKYSDPELQVESGTNTYTQTAATDKSALDAAINAAQAAQEGVNVSEDGKDVEPTEKYVTPAEKAALEQAIAHAQAVFADSTASQTNIDNEVTALEAATATFEAAKKDGTKETEPVVEKPVNVVISRGDGITEEDQFQPATGGTYIWTVSDINYGKLEGRIDEEDFKLQTKKVADNDWADATEGSLSIEIDVDEEYGMDMATITAIIPDNTDSFDKDWRIAYIYTEPDSQYETCGAEFYTQMAAEEPPAEKLALVIVADDESVPAEGGSISWGIFSYEGEDLEGAISGSDFTVQVDGTDAGIDAVFEAGNNDDEGTVTVTVPANEAAAEKIWTLKYDGDLYVHDGEALKPGSCPAITQAAKSDEPVDEAVEAVKEKINALPAADAVTVDDKAAIEEARAAYDALTDEQKAEIDADTLNKLTAAEEALTAAEEAAADEAAADAVKEKINALPAADAVTTDDKAAIEEARAAYDALTDEQKAKVDADTLKKLTDAEEALKAAEEAAEDTAAVDAVKEKINALPAADQVTTADKAKIEEARAAYDALTDEQKANVDADTLKKLTDAEKALSDAQAAAQAAEAQKAAEEKAKSITSVTVSGKTVNADAIATAIAAAGGRPEYVTEIVLDKSVKKISKSAFAGTNVTTLVVKTKKLTKKSVKGSLKGSSVKTVKVKIGKAKTNKKYVKKYKKYFTKKNAGKKVKVKK